MQMTAAGAVSRRRPCFLVISSFFVLINDCKILALKSKTHQTKRGGEVVQPSINSSCSPRGINPFEPSEDPAKPGVGWGREDGKMGDGAGGMLLAPSPGLGYSSFQASLLPDEDRLSKRKSIGETISLQVEVESRNSPEKEEVSVLLDQVVRHSMIQPP